jgi:hypothetical protein
MTNTPDLLHGYCQKHDLLHLLGEGVTG